jgi:hypothetical protein
MHKYCNIFLKLKLLPAFSVEIRTDFFVKIPKITFPLKSAYLQLLGSRLSDLSKRFLSFLSEEVGAVSELCQENTSS